MTYTEKQIEHADQLHDEIRDRKHDEEQQQKRDKLRIEQLSKLLRGCQACGAQFKTGLVTEITMPDKSIYTLEEATNSWMVYSPEDARVTRIPKDASAKTIQRNLLEAHIRFLKEFS